MATLSKIPLTGKRTFKTGSVNNTPARVSELNTVIDGINSIDTTTINTSGAVTLGSTLAVTGISTLGSLTTTGALTLKRSLTAVATTAAATLTVVKAGLLTGGFSSTSAAGVSIVLDSIANIITAYATAGVTITTGSQILFIVDNSQGSSTVTVAVDAGTTIAVATPALTGGATLTVSTANKVGLFSLYLTSATTGILSRII
jgi:hypothetical protein